MSPTSLKPCRTATLVGVLLCAVILALPVRGASAEVVTVSADNTRIDRSCTIRIPPDLVIPDADGDGVIHIVADDITVEFEPGSELRGARTGSPGDALAGTGIRISNVRGVIVLNAAISGYKIALHATECRGLRVRNATVNSNYRQRLHSTPAAEDLRDWLWPHKNDDGEWARTWGAALWLERCEFPRVSFLKVRNAQNGIILDRTNNGIVEWSDCSFLSGWGLALWRSSRNLIEDNRFDFCIRGYSHGVYNRGQDSAGILCFEQSSENRFIANSATHGGDGFFGFAGREALGETQPKAAALDLARRGCNGNALLFNDFSFAAAHGIEMTFSFDNTFAYNTIHQNAGCGIWAGYSQDTLIYMNTFQGNGLPGRAEGGAINIEHGFRNRIELNRFRRNSVGVALWSDADEAIMKLPWAAVNHRGSSDNVIARNSFLGEPTPIRLRRTPVTEVYGNGLEPLPAEIAMNERGVADRLARGELSPNTIDRCAESAVIGKRPAPTDFPALEDRRPPKRPLRDTFLRGRENIVMGEWGPWDHESPLLRLRERSGSSLIYELFLPTLGPSAVGDDDPSPVVEIRSPGIDLRTIEPGGVGPEPGPPRWTFILSSAQSTPGSAVRVEAEIKHRHFAERIDHTFVHAEWDVRAWNWTADPITDLATWRTEAVAPDARVLQLDRLRMPFGHRGSGAPGLPGSVREAGLLPNRIGLIASTTLRLPAGSWRFRTLSDDGVRVRIDGGIVIERWDIHGPTEDAATFTTDRSRSVRVEVEYFQNDGYAVLKADLQALPAAPISEREAAAP